MQLKLTNCSFLFMLLIFGVLVFVAYGGRYFTKYEQTKVMAGSVLSERKASSGMFCSYQCSQVDGCQSVSFNDATRDCLLSETTTSEISGHTTADVAWTTFSMYDAHPTTTSSSSTTTAQTPGQTTTTTAATSTTLATTPTCSTSTTTSTSSTILSLTSTTALTNQTSISTSTTTSKTTTNNSTTPTTTPAPNLAVSEGDIRLVGGQDSSRGRLEIHHDSTWMQVLGNNWGWKMTKTACRQMGYNYGGCHHGYKGYGAGKGTSVVLKNINCIGTETRLTDCGITNYDYLEKNSIWDLGLTCYTENIESGFIRLRSPDGNTGADVMSGIAEVKHDNTWGSICGYKWDRSDSDLFCSGLNKEWALRDHCIEDCAIQGDGPVWMTNVVCNDNPPHILYCRHTRWGVINLSQGGYECTHNKDVNIDCGLRL